MKSSTISLIKLEPSENMHLKNIITGEIFDSFIYLAKSLDVSDFEEITKEEYQEIIQSELSQKNIQLELPQENIQSKLPQENIRKFRHTL